METITEKPFTERLTRQLIRDAELMEQHYTGVEFDIATLDWQVWQSGKSIGWGKTYRIAADYLGECVA